MDEVLKEITWRIEEKKHVEFCLFTSYQHSNDIFDTFQHANWVIQQGVDGITFEYKGEKKFRVWYEFTPPLKTKIQIKSERYYENNKGLEKTDISISK